MPAVGLNWTERSSASRCCWLAIPILATLAAASGAGAETFNCPDGALAPFTAEYEVRRNDKRLGTAEVELEREGGSWTYTTKTKAERGIAGLLGGQVLELTEFDYERGEPRSRRYRYTRGVALSKRSTFAEFDWGQMRASGNYKKKEWSMPLEPGQTDRMLVNLLMMRALKRNVPRLSFDTIEKGRLERLSFVRDGSAEVDTSTGRHATIAVRREHQNKRRRTESWHAPKLNYLPVRLRQIDEEDDETIELTLEAFELQPCQSD